MIGRFLHPEVDNIVQVGLGPTGLAYALEACFNDSKKRKVILITDRIAYTRDVIFRLDTKIFEYYRQLIGETAYQEALNKGLIGPVEDENVSGFFGVKTPHRVIKIKTCEKLLYDQLAKLPQVELIILAKHHTTDRILEVNRNSNTIVILKDNRARAIHFSYLIETDGIHHDTLNLIKNNKVYYHSRQISQVHSHHARITFNLPSDYTADKFRALLNSGSADAPPAIIEFQQLGWELHSVPEFRLFIIEDTFYVGGECPSQIQSADKQKIDTWVRVALRMFLPQKIVKDLTNRESAAFDVVLDEADHPTLVLSPDHATPGILFLAGEVLRKSHYQTGSGAAVGLEEAAAFGAFLKTPQARSDLYKYNEAIKGILTVNRARVDSYLTHRAMREAAAQAPALLAHTQQYPKFFPAANSQSQLPSSKVSDAVSSLSGKDKLFAKKTERPLPLASPVAQQSTIDYRRYY
jgi:hypothetical protein